VTDGRDRAVVRSLTFLFLSGSRECLLKTCGGIPCTGWPVVILEVHHAGKGTAAEMACEQPLAAAFPDPPW
jgi:hypothetical protein